MSTETCANKCIHATVDVIVLVGTNAKIMMWKSMHTKIGDVDAHVRRHDNVHVDVEVHENEHVQLLVEMLHVRCRVPIVKN